MAAVRCPYGEARGATVYCRAAGRTVNPLVMPCRSPNYPRCRFYREAEERRKAEAKAERPPEPARAEAAAGGSASPKPAAAPGGGEAPARAAGAERRWDSEESRRLSDPLTVARLLVEARAEASGSVEASGIDEAERTLGAMAPGEGCFLVVASGGGETVYMKLCRGEIVAAASTSRGPLDPGGLESVLKALGRLSVVVYRVAGWG